MGTCEQSSHPGRRSGRGRLRAVACAILVASTGACAHADPDPPERSSVETLGAFAAARVGLLDLRLSGATTPRDYRVAEELLGVAARLTDQSASNLDASRRSSAIADQQTIYRLYLEAATGADDVPTIRQIIARLVQLDPLDTVSQLRLISAKISDYQTADERLAAYERFLGPEGEVFDDSVRSRLAVDAALLLRERGDKKGFARMLSRAIALDLTNKDAAMLGMTFWAQNPEEIPAEERPLAMLDWKFCVLKADPFDVAVYSSIVDQLLGEGAYTGAFHFAKLHRQLCAVQNRPLTEAEEFAYDIAEWNAVGPDAVIRRLSDLLEKARQQAFEQRKIAAERGQPVDGLARPEELRLSFAQDRMRALAAASQGDRERAAVFIGELGETVRVRSERAMDPARRPAGITEEQALGATRVAAVELAWLRLWVGVQVSEAAATVAQLAEAGALDEATHARLDAWVALRTGETERADRALRAIADRDPMGALGLAVLAEVRGDEATAVVRYRDLASRSPGTDVGAFAARRYGAFAREKPRSSDIAIELEKNAAGVPKWLDAMVENPRRIMTLEARALRSEISPLDRTPVRVTLRNVSSIPLALGPNQPLNSRILFGPAIETGSARLPSNELGHVASLDRRLRLLPNESVDIVTFPDMGVLSFVAELALPGQSRIRWRVLQGFQLVDQRVYDAGPRCLTTDVATMLRRLPNRAEAVFTALQYALQTGGPREIADAVLSLRLQMSMGSNLNAADVDRLIEVIARRFGTMQRASKIMVLCLVPSQADLPQVVRVDQILPQETDEDVLCVALATRVVRPDDPLLRAPGVLKSTRLASLAQVVQDRLASGTRTYATSSLQVPALVGGIAPPAEPEAPKPLNLDGAKPNDPNAPASPGPQRSVAPVDPPDPSPVPILP
ncbi:MAG TPA: hypothetical protein PKE29_00130 [Phycisphaerales bacterium]|nr:hypothetical protein [Phycisphaerales bacterium]